MMRLLSFSGCERIKPICLFKPDTPLSEIMDHIKKDVKKHNPDVEDIQLHLVEKWEYEIVNISSDGEDWEDGYILEYVPIIN